MNYAVIIAGGSGLRTGQDIPKQFMFVNDKPIIIWTLEKFQASPLIDKIVVVCLAGWETFLKTYANQFNISKLSQIIEGGKTRFSSICKAIQALESNASVDDIVLFFDANRPLITDEMIEDSIQKCAVSRGGAVGVMPCYDSMFRGSCDTSYLLSSENRASLYVGTGPEAVTYCNAHKLYNKYKNIDASPTIPDLLISEGIPVACSKSSAKCFKLTTVEDLEIFKAILQTEKFSWLK